MIQTRNKKIFSWVLILAMVLSVIAPGSASVVNAEETDYQAKLTAVTKCLHDNVEPVYSGEWALIQQARSENPDKKWMHTYYESLVEQLEDEEKTSKMEPNDWARVLLAVEALGENPADFNGKNLFQNLADFSKIYTGSIYDVSTIAYILMAVGNRNDDVFLSDKVSKDNLTTKAKLKEAILSNYDKDNKGWGGPDWDTGEWTFDPDISSQAIQALSAYYSDEKIKEIIDNTLTSLSTKVLDDNACVVAWGSANPCSTAQVICALSAVGIDLTKDERFIKNGKTLIDGLCTFFDPVTGGVKAISYYTGEEYLDLAYNTVQAGYALTAYDRFVNEKSFIFNINDVTEPIYTCGEGKHVFGAEKEEYKKPTCTENGTVAIRCSKCGEVKQGSEETGKKALGHAGGTATCVSKAICEKCGVEYGELNPDNHDGTTSIVGKKDASCTDKGYTGDKVCDDCGKLVEKGKEIAASGHKGGKANCVKKAVCEVCGKEYGEIDQFNHTGKTVIKNAKAATLTEKGYSGDKVCDGCGVLLEAGTETPKVEAENKSYTINSASSNPTVEYTGATENNKAVVTIQNTAKDSNGVSYKVTKVADNAFAGNKIITDVTMGENITEIGANAFKNCTKLSGIIVQSDSISKIGDSAFAGDKALKAVDFSECKLQTIDKNAFSGCKKLKSIRINGNKLTKVGKNAFKNIKKNAKIIIYAKNKKAYKKVVKLIKKSGAKKVKYSYKKKK